MQILMGLNGSCVAIRIQILLMDLFQSYKSLIASFSVRNNNELFVFHLLVFLKVLQLVQLTNLMIIMPLSVFLLPPEMIQKVDIATSLWSMWKLGYTKEVYHNLHGYPLPVNARTTNVSNPLNRFCTTISAPLSQPSSILNSWIFYKMVNLPMS